MEHLLSPKTEVSGRTPVAELGFSARLQDIFRRGRRGGGRIDIYIRTLDDFTRVTETDLLWLLGYGKAALRETKEILAKHGRKLKPKDLHEVSTDTLNLSAQAKAALDAEKITSVGALIWTTETGLLTRRNMNRELVNNIKKALAEQGLGLRKI